MSTNNLIGLLASLTDEAVSRVFSRLPPAVGLTNDGNPTPLDRDPTADDLQMISLGATFTLSYAVD